MTAAEQAVEKVMGDYLESLHRPYPFARLQHPAVIIAQNVALYALRAVTHVVLIIL
jgi:hypothetical protein